MPSKGVVTPRNHNIQIQRGREAEGQDGSSEVGQGDSAVGFFTSRHRYGKARRPGPPNASDSGTYPVQLQLRLVGLNEDLECLSAGNIFGMQFLLHEGVALSIRPQERGILGDVMLEYLEVREGGREGGREGFGVRGFVLAGATRPAQTTRSAVAGYVCPPLCPTPIWTARRKGPNHPPLCNSRAAAS